MHSRSRGGFVVYLYLVFLPAGGGVRKIFYRDHGLLV